MTARSEWYRLNAEKCLALAQRSNDPESQRSLLAMANAWLALAEQVRTRKGIVTITESPSDRMTSSPPVEPEAC